MEDVQRMLADEAFWADVAKAIKEDETLLTRAIEKLHEEEEK